jgi:solute carrier family 41
MIDNITAPVATCLGDLLTLFILALLGSLLVGTMDTPIPLIAVILMGLAGVWFTRAVMRDEWVKNVAKGGWAPLVNSLPKSNVIVLMTDRSYAHFEWNRNGIRCRCRSI